MTREKRLSISFGKGSGVIPTLVMLGGLGLWAGVPAGWAQDAAPAAQEAQGQRTDGQIEMDVVHAIDAAPSLSQDWITAGTVQGEVTLSGTSGSDANRKLAESIASKVPGVTKVVNNLKVGDPQTAQDNSGQPGQGEYADPSGGQNGPQGQPAQPGDQSGNNGEYGNVPPPPPPGQPSNRADNQGPPQGQPNYPPQGNQPYYQPRQPMAPEPPHGPVTLAQGTLLKVRSSEPLDSKKAKVGTPVEFTVVRDIYSGGVLAVPRGATIHGEVVDAKQAGALGGNAELALKLDTLELGGQAYPLDSTPFVVKSPNKAGRTVGNAIGGALFGALIGGAVGGGGGAAIGAGAGAVGGTAASAASPGPRVWIPAEALMDFHINAPVTVNPVSYREAQRLAANAPPPSQRPTLYRRGYYAYPYGYPAPPPPGYYYRPY